MITQSAAPITNRSIYRSPVHPAACCHRCIHRGIKVPPPFLARPDRWQAAAGRRRVEVEGGHKGLAVWRDRGRNGCFIFIHRQDVPGEKLLVFQSSYPLRFFFSFSPRLPGYAARGHFLHSSHISRAPFLCLLCTAESADRQLTTRSVLIFKNAETWLVPSYSIFKRTVLGCFPTRCRQSSRFPCHIFSLAPQDLVLQSWSFFPFSPSSIEKNNVLLNRLAASQLSSAHPFPRPRRNPCLDTFQQH